MLILFFFNVEENCNSVYSGVILGTSQYNSCMFVTEERALVELVLNLLVDVPQLIDLII